MLFLLPGIAVPSVGKGCLVYWEFFLSLFSFLAYLQLSTSFPKGVARYIPLQSVSVRLRNLYLLFKQTRSSCLLLLVIRANAGPFDSERLIEPARLQIRKIPPQKPSLIDR